MDTTGAGDAFTASFAVGLLENFEKYFENRDAFYIKSMELATQTAFLTISRFGAGPAMPYRKEINQVFLN